MKSRYQVGVLVVAAGAILAPIVSRASHPLHLPKLARSVQTTAQAVPEASGTALYTFTAIDAPGSLSTTAFGINNPGLVSGFYVDANGHANGFLWQNGKLTTVDFPGAEHTLLGNVSNSGLAVGNYGPFDTQHAAIYNMAFGTWVTLPDVPNLPINVGNGINPQGTAVGSAGIGNLNVASSFVGWIWDGKYSFFAVPGAGTDLGTEPIGINSQGDVSGDFSDSSGIVHGFLKKGSNFTQIDVPGATNTYAGGINNRGDVVGYYLDQQFFAHGFLLRSGQFTTIDVPGAINTFLYNINDPGYLAGFFEDSTGVFHGLIASRH